MLKFIELHIYIIVSRCVRIYQTSVDVMCSTLIHCVRRNEGKQNGSYEKKLLYRTFACKIEFCFQEKE